ncbi:thiol reductant ABC exporter subunit CydD [Amycolatopsis rubida]|uniref:Thiol reductant ABC exporter subunit CydD n=1 Tax=Amycolatopsis rubida TaxID=112413 RepID=A0ABX0C6T3_9PSEU|nr:MULTISPECIES: thiol reductant ABC exporter subunit CydD [Amycolatopsis]MYW97058.1 thiol reductant ABC exporter subunit CydD [Amycolatopsis rubida]NEC62043.1 thiol reductant ABC exporter subunit CydD [Amycolatopsis rubida]
MDPVRPGKGPLGALSALGPAARRALILVAVLSFGNAVFLVGQAFLLADILADVVSRGLGEGGRTVQLTVLFALVVGRAGTSWAVRVVSARAAATAQRDLRARVVDHALRLGPEWLARRGHGELTTLVTRGLDALDSYFREYLPALVTAAVVPVAAGAAILWTDWPSAVIIAATVPLLPMFAVLVGKFTADRVSGATDAVHRMSGLLLELVRALPVLTAFRRAEAQAETVRKLSDRHRRATLKTLRVAFSSAFVLELAATLSVALVAVVIGVRLVSGSLPLAIGLGVLILAPECYQPIRAVGAAFHASEDGVEAVRRVTAVLAEPVPAEGTRTAPCGSLVVSDLKVARRGGFAPDGESFSVRRGQIVWLRAPSGGGKSTTLATLLGFVPSYDGSVRAGDVPLAEADLERWRAGIAWVPQSPVFSGGTVREELAVAGSDIDTVLGELGLHGLADRPVDRLSQGQRQRVAVARALLRVQSDAWLLLLDEPTAHLDDVNARRVIDAVERAVENGAAAVIAAHERSAAVTVSDSSPAAVVESTSDTVDARPLPWRMLLDRRLFSGALLGALALLAGIALTATSGWLIAKASSQPPILTLTVAVVGVRAFGLGRAGLRYVERLVTHDAAFRIAGRLRVRLWNALVRLGPARSLEAGESQRRLVTDVDTVRDLLPRVVSPPIVVGLVAAGAIAVQTLVLQSAGLVLALTVLVGLAAPAVALRLERRATSALAAGRRDVAAQVLVLFSSAAELLAYGRAASRRRDLASTDTQLAADTRRQAFGAGAADALITLATGAAAVVSTMLAASAVGRGELAGVMAPLLALVPLALAEVLALLPQAAVHGDTLRAARVRLGAVVGESTAENSQGAAGSAGGSYEAAGSVLVESEAGRSRGVYEAAGSVIVESEAGRSRGVHEAAGRVIAKPVVGRPRGAAGSVGGAYEAVRRASAEPVDEAGHVVARSAGEPDRNRADAVRLRGAELGWPGGEAVLKDVELSVPTGAYVAVVGPSGAGKSTLVAALLGFLQPRRGEIVVPGKVAWAPQEPMLVSTTVAENLRLADPLAETSDLRWALDQAQLPELDLATVLDSAGAGLSGGQAQRVALARALLAAPSAELVLLDEPTSHLDEPTARALRAMLHTELAGRTVVHVTHNADEELQADIVFEVRDGHVVRRALPRVAA